MKKLYGKLWVKCTAVALLFVFAALLCLSVLGVAWLAVYDAYVDGGEAVRNQARKEILRQSISDGWTAFFAYAENNEQELKLILEKYGGQTASNIYFELVDPETGNVLLSTGESHDRHYVINYCAYLTEDMTYVSLTDEAQTVAQFRAWLREPLAVHDRAYTVMQWVERLLAARGWLIVLAGAAFAACLILLIFLLCAVGHKEGVEGAYLCWLNRIPMDIFLVLLLVGGVFWLALTLENLSGGWAVLICLCGLMPLGLTLVLSIAARAKAPGFFRNSVIFRLVSWVVRALAKLPLVWRTMLFWCALCAVELFLLAVGGMSGEGAAIWLLLRGVLSVVLLYLAAALKRLQQTGQALADGKTDVAGSNIPRWLPALRAHESNLQSIQAGIQKAVAEQTRAERMKTELITNVSHDIKTPLTSIVNYVDLLEKEPLEPEKAREYVAVLERQAARLKKLTEDLVEASKASSGALPVHPAYTDVNVLLSQLAGEYMHKLEQAQLEPVFKPDAAQPGIMADGQLLSRVLGNLFSNVCKYAMPGTRVYFESAADETTVTITFKNISRYELDIPAEELMARFVRADRSRHTEGSGLGLSIAQSLTELQGGTFHIEIDGDLFKAVITFPRAAA